MYHSPKHCIVIVVLGLSLQFLHAAFVRGNVDVVEQDEVHVALFLSGSGAAQKALEARERFGDVTLHFVADAAAREALPDDVKQYNLEAARPMLEEARLDCCQQAVCFPSLAKLFAFKLLPLDRVLVLDTDLYVNCDLRKLWHEFDHFSSDEVIALAPEQAASYEQDALDFSKPGPRAPNFGFNGGVQLQYLARMRTGTYEKTLQSHSVHRLCGINMLADQGVITDLHLVAPNLVHELPCSWNVQASLYWAAVLDNITDPSDPSLADHRCGEATCICHSNTGGIWGHCGKGSAGWEVVAPDSSEILQRAERIRKQRDVQQGLHNFRQLFSHSTFLR